METLQALKEYKRRHVEAAEKWEDDGEGGSSLTEEERDFARNPDPPRKYIWKKGTKDELKLGTWVSHQRSNKKNGKLSENRIASLQALTPPLVWDPTEAAFQTGLQALKEYKRRHVEALEKERGEGGGGGEGGSSLTEEERDFARNPDPPQRYIWKKGTMDELNLGSWVNSQRKNKKNGTLSEDQIAALEALTPALVWAP